jgi:hypothetical protein
LQCTESLYRYSSAPSLHQLEIFKSHHQSDHFMLAHVVCCSSAHHVRAGRMLPVNTIWNVCQHDLYDNGSVAQVDGQCDTLHHSWFDCPADFSISIFVKACGQLSSRVAINSGNPNLEIIQPRGNVRRRRLAASKLMLLSFVFCCCCNIPLMIIPSSFPELMAALPTLGVWLRVPYALQFALNPVTQSITILSIFQPWGPPS